MMASLLVVLVGMIQGAAAEPPAIDPKTVQDWVQVLKEGDREAGIKAARLWVGSLGDADPSARRRAAVVLRAGIAHFSPDVRTRAQEVLAQIGPDAKAVVPALVAMLSDPDAMVSTSAGMVLGEFGPAAEAAIPTLLPRLADRHYLGAAVTLGQIGPAAIPPLVKLLKSGGQWDRVAPLPPLASWAPRPGHASPRIRRAPAGRRAIPE